jgi:hypothetical protein
MNGHETHLYREIIPVYLCSTRAPGLMSPVIFVFLLVCMVSKKIECIVNLHHVALDHAEAHQLLNRRGDLH